MWQHVKYWTGRIVTAILVGLFLFAFAQTLPVDFAVLIALDMALYVDALIGVYVIGSVTKLRAAATYYRLLAVNRIRRLGKRARRVAGRVASRLKQPANDDDPAWTMAA